ncbi:MAG: YheC/YheD family protein [Syntrophomonadaceae bacterium]|nr:YheC/YheD family protein [Syntrophomonadaceae bacterium]
MRNINDYSCTIGVLTSPEMTNGGYPRGKKSKLYKEMLTYAEKRNVLVFFFYADNVDWKHQQIKGYTSAKNNRWINKVYPMPDIVYNRIRYRSIEGKMQIRNVLQKFEQNQHIYLFNSRFLNKWEIYQAMCQYPAELETFPPTALFNKQSFKEFLCKYQEVYLKPVNGSVGKGIIKVISVSDHYLYAEAQPKRIIWKKYSSFKNLYEQLKRLDVMDNQYLVQKAIDLATYDGKIFDLRSQMQKNGQGEWVLTGIAVRIAGKDRIVTHIPNGGCAASYDQVISHIFGNYPEKTEGLKSQLTRIGAQIPQILERELGIRLAVLSIDIGVDAEGKMWVIEVNSKPASFDEDDIRQKHLKFLIDYCLYITRNK